MAYKPPRAFLDTSALLAGLISSKGAARQLLAAAEMGLIELLISTQVLLEADRNISKKFPHLLDDYRHFVKELKPTLCEDPTVEEIRHVLSWIEPSDAPILAAALKCHPDYLVSWNTKDFMGSRMPEHLALKIRTPTEFIAEWSATLHHE